MVFTKRLRAGVRHGAITCSVRIWTRPKVKVGARYRMEEGEIEVDSIEQIRLRDITNELAVESGFPGTSDLLKVAKHGPGDNVYLIRFHYIPPFRKAPLATRQIGQRVICHLYRMRISITAGVASLTSRFKEPDCLHAIS